MRIKDYADSKGVTSQTIYKKMRSPKYKERLKGHLYRDNQKVENLDLIGIKILEDYAFENDVIKLEKELVELRIQFEDREKQLLECLEKLEMENKIVNGYLQNSHRNVQAWTDYAGSLEMERLYLIVALAIVLLAFLIAMGFAVF